MLQGLVEYATYVALFLSTLFTVFLVTAPTQLVQKKKTEDGAETTSVQVVVLGDIGRSPRMQYHALSIAKHNGRVDLIGYCESELHPDIVGNDRITIVPIEPFPAWLRANSKLVFLLVAPLKVFWQVWGLYYTLGYKCQPAEWMLVQNPPSIPTLVVARIISILRHTKLIIDWHNFGYTILALRLGPSHPLIKIARMYEKFFGGLARYHFTVTDAMGEFLKSGWDITPFTLHDRPAAIFQPFQSSTERDYFLSSLPETAEHSRQLSARKLRLIVSSTSWTADEDFGVLLAGLLSYSELSLKDTHLPPILAIITGKGPMKAHYLAQIQNLNKSNRLQNVTILTAWLSTNDYASLLAAADLGISLHTSSSGLDLPMKVVDMFGAGLPVLGWSAYKAWPELVKEDVNGKGFESAEGLCSLLVDLFGYGQGKLDVLKEGAMKECSKRWDAEWDPVAGRLLGLVDESR